jgi:hypothetical protein
MAQPLPACCPEPLHPPRIDIPPGMATLPDRQIGTFADWRRALLHAIGDPWSAALWPAPAKPWPLTAWTADRPDDLGVMLLEFWAYVLDICAFYDARLAERAYLGTAQEADTLAEIVALIGYQPRPALAGSVTLALLADGADPVNVPSGAAFRSAAFGSEPPQTFEMLAGATIWPQRNRWQLAPYRPDKFDGVLRFRPGEAPQRGAVVALSLAGVAKFAGQVAVVDTETNLDGERYQRVTFASTAGLPSLIAKPLSKISASALTLRVALWSYDDTANSGASGGTGWVLLDAYYSTLTPGSAAALEIDGKLHPITIKAHDRQSIAVAFSTGDNAVSQNIAASKISFAWSAAAPSGAIHFLGAPRPLGLPTRPALLKRSLADIRTAPTLAPVVPALGDAPGDAPALAQGQAAAGVAISGTVEPDGDGGGDFVPAGDAKPFATPLTTPVSLFGNVVNAVRGQSVTGEALGSGNAAAASQSFSLARKPLTWVTDAGSPIGRSPQLQIAVDGLYWTWAPSFFGKGPSDRVFTVTMASDGGATVCFGDGVNGARLPTGVGNVMANYRYGAGKLAPPANSITQIAKAVQGLKSVVSPLAALPGADAEAPDAIRVTAPAAMMAMDRAVSPDDYLALARNYTGIVNAAVSESWDAAGLQVVIDVLIIPDPADPGADPSGDLTQWLTDRSAPGIPVKVTLATPETLTRFDIAVTVAAGFVPDTVRAGVSRALLDPETGLLCPARLPLGAPLFRSVIMAAAFAVPGVAGIAITLADGPMGEALTPDPGAWLDILTNAKVL